ncbi:MAG: TVP38/TMEM64 family protein [Polyangiaceae bacterium]|nr:TVP38/TMEM64 family protein [Polyangiaceae bacterium]
MTMVKARVAAVATVLALLALAYHLGLFERFAAPERARDALLALGPWGYLAFIGAYTTLQPFGVPGTVFIVAAPLVWPWPVAFALSMTGTMSASVVGFSFARFVARDWFASRIPARLRRYDEALERRAFATVVVLRFVLWMPPLLHAFFGVSRVRFWTHFWGSVIGYTPPLLAVSYFGPRLFERLRAAPRDAWGWVAAALAVAVALGFAWRLRSRARRA